MINLKQVVATLLVVTAVLGEVMPAFANDPEQPDPLVVMDNVSIAEGEEFVYTVTLDNFRFTNVEIEINMGAFDVRVESVNVSGVDTFSPDYDASTHVLTIQIFTFEPSEGAVITIPLDEPIDSDVVVTRLRIGNDADYRGEIAKGRVIVLQSQARVFLPSIATMAVAR